MSREPYLRLFGTRLYASASGQYLALAPDYALPPPESLSLEDAVSSAGYRVTFFFPGEECHVSSAEDAKCVLALISTALGEGRRGVVWAGQGGTAVLPLTDDASALSAVFLPAITEQLSLIVPVGTRVAFSVQEGILRLEQYGEPFRLSTVGYACTFSNAVLALCGAQAGQLSFSVQVAYDDFVASFPSGFEYSWNGGAAPLSFPLLEYYSESPILPLRFHLNFSARAGSSALFVREGIRLATGFRTVYGERVFLEATVSGGFCFPSRPVRNSVLMLAPLGDYRVCTESGGDVKLLCGLSGTEQLVLPQNGVATFVSEQPAYAPGFPGKALSIADYVEPPARLPLSDTAVTSWLALSGGEYVSEPSEAPYYGGFGAILLHAPTAVTLPPAVPPVPMVPYGALQKALPETAAYEAQVLSCCRSELMAGCAAARRVLHTEACTGNAPRTAASPAGYLVETAGTSWKKLQLAVSDCGGLAFQNPAPPLVAAFSSAGLFLVGAREGAFPQTTVSMGDWSLPLLVGAGCAYNNYRNLLLVKSLPGKLYDPDAPEKSLISSVSGWTLRAEFSSPCGDVGQQSNLANYITDYFAKAYAQRINPYFSGFAAAITDESWQGFLFLNVSLAAESFPPELRSLLPQEGGVSLHHLGACITPLKPGPNGPETDGESSLFGLIHYQAEGFAEAVLPPEVETGFAYRSLQMKVLFQNSAVARFESTAQLTIGDFLGIRPTMGGCPYNTVLLKGAYQAEDGEPSYTLGSVGENVLLFEVGPLSRVVLDKVSLSGSEGGNCFEISGQMAFVEGEGDVWSYKSLAFSGMKLTETAGHFCCDVKSLTFDLPHSLLRENSFAGVFAMTPEELICGDKNAVPQKKGYAPITTEWLRNAVFEGDWCGLRLRATLGTTGELAGNSGISASILLAWDGGGKLFAGIALPGAVMIENVLGLSVGAARLVRQEGRLMLLLSDVALKCLGLLKLPPSGSLTMSMFEGTGWFAMYKKGG